MTLTSQAIGLTSKIVANFVGIVMLFGLFVVGVVYQLTERTLKEQFQERALAIGTNLSDAAAGHVMGRNILELHALVTKYARLQGAAYAYIEDGTGQTLAHSFGTFPAEIQEALTFDQRRQVSRKILTLQGKPVYETRVPILEGQIGAAHVGLWGDSVETEIYNALLPIVGLIGIGLLAAVMLALFLARGIIRPIRRLTDMAGKMSMGNLQTPVTIESRDEIGDLARSLERLRASLTAAMTRLQSHP